MKIGKGGKRELGNKVRLVKRYREGNQQRKEKRSLKDREIKVETFENKGK